MGGIAVRDRPAARSGEGRVPGTQILLLLDREADRFLAKRADVDGVLVKPVDAGSLRRAAKALLRHGERLRLTGLSWSLHCPALTGCGAAWLARSVRDAEAPGSNPGIPTTVQDGYAGVPL